MTPGGRPSSADLLPPVATWYALLTLLPFVARGRWTPLLAAAMHGRLRCVKELLARGARIHAAANTGKTALEYSRESARAPPTQPHAWALKRISLAHPAAEPTLPPCVVVWLLISGSSQGSDTGERRHDA